MKLLAMWKDRCILGPTLLATAHPQRHATDASYDGRIRLPTSMSTLDEVVAPHVR